MQETAAQGMRPIWKIVIFSMLFSLGAGMMWHFSQMRDVHYREQTQDQPVRDEILLLRAYRDVLKKDGLESAKAYLQKIPPQSYVR